MSNLAVHTNSQGMIVPELGQIMEKVLLAGDLSKMEPMDRIKYYLKTCESLGMNPLTKPFDLITMNGKMVLYPNRSGTDQLRNIGKVDTQITDKKFDKDTGCYVVTARAKLPNGRTDEDMGVVFCAGLKGEALANAQLKAMTKAKRRVTLSIMGLGWIDESEVSSVKNAHLSKMDLETGNIIDVGPTQSEPIKKDSEGLSEGTDETPRNEQNKRVMALYKPYLQKFPHTKISTLLKDRYGAEETRLITVEQLTDFANFLEARLSGATSEKSPIKPQQTAGTPATKEQIQELFAYAKDQGLDKSHLDEFIKKEFEKNSWVGISFNELLIVRDAIHDGELKSVEAPQSNVIPPQNLPWNQQKEGHLI